MTENIFYSFLPVVLITRYGLSTLRLLTTLLDEHRRNADLGIV
jgi:hypothetical protein